MTVPPPTLRVCEIFKSIQGESTRAGAVCTFVRLSGCNLSCTYCDTVYANGESTSMTMEDILAEIVTRGCRTVEVTGGEPLLQRETPDLCERLIAQGYTVLVETNGSLDIAPIPVDCTRLVDIKCPGSGMGGTFLMRNLEEVSPNDECKMVIADRSDFDWAANFVGTHNLTDLCTVLFSPVSPRLSLADLAQWILESQLPVRLGYQLHKIIWGNDARGR